MLFMNRENVLNLRSFWQIQIIGWCGYYLFHLLEMINAFFTKRAVFVEETVPVFLMFLGSFVLRPFCRWLMRQSRSWIAYELKSAAAAMVISIPVTCATGLILQNFNHVPWHALVAVWAWSFFMLLMWCSLYFSIKQWQQSSMEKERLLRAESELREARLLALRYQLNPHFLFNSLNAVSTLVLEGNAPAATRMLAEIGDLLRTTLDNDASPEIPLSQEIAFIERYLAIEQTRLGGRLRVEMTISQDTFDAVVPSMLLQPLVENAVRHGVAPTIEGGTIRIESRIHNDRLLLTIKNSAPR